MCEQCNSTVSQKDNLIKHVVLQHGKYSIIHFHLSYLVIGNNCK